MAENKKSFLLYCDLIHTVEKMPKEKAGELFLHILQYVNDKNPISEDLIINLTFEPIKQSLKRDLIKYEKIRLRNQENIGKRWNKEDTKNTTGKTGIPNDTKNTVSDSVSDSDSVLLKKETKYIFDFKRELIAFGFEDEKMVDEWLLIRKKLKAVNTETAFKKFIEEVRKAQIEFSLKQILEECVSRSWKGFKYDWIKSEQIKIKEQPKVVSSTRYPQQNG